MQRLFLALWGLFLLSVTPVLAGEFVNEPPLTGDMVKLELFPKPVKLPEVLLSADGGGLEYLSKYRGTIVVLNVWATWCPPCIEELPSLNSLQYAMDPETVNVVTVSLDTTGMDKVKKFMLDKNLDKLPPYVEVENSIQKLDAMKDVAGVPVTLILDPQMRMIARMQGPADWGGRSARAVLDYYIENVSFVAVTI